MEIFALLFTLNILFFIASLILSSKLKLQPSEKGLGAIFLLPIVIGFFFTLGIAVHPVFLIMTFLSAVYLLYFSIKNDEVILSTVKIRKTPVLIAVVFVLNLVGGFLFNIARFATSGDTAVITMILISGIALMAVSKSVLFSLIAYILKTKGYSKVSSLFLGFLGFFGLLISLILADKKEKSTGQEG